MYWLLLTMAVIVWLWAVTDFVGCKFLLLTMQQSLNQWSFIVSTIVTDISGIHIRTLHCQYPCYWQCCNTHYNPTLSVLWLLTVLHWKYLSCFVSPYVPPNMESINSCYWQCSHATSNPPLSPRLNIESSQHLTQGYCLNWCYWQCSQAKSKPALSVSHS